MTFYQKEILGLQRVPLLCQQKSQNTVKIIEFVHYSVSLTQKKAMKGPVLIFWKDLGARSCFSFNANWILQPSLIWKGLFKIDDTTSSHDAKSREHAVSIQKHCLEGLLCLFRHLGEAYLALSHFHCKKALKAFEEIEPHHQNTAWVIGKRYF